MTTFTSFSNLLPDPANPMTDAGDISTVVGTPGPGFAAINFKSNTNTQASRTISGRGVQRDGGVQYWDFTISYNPMFRESFDVVDSFLAGRNPRKDPFYVILPQYAKPKDPAFASFCLSNIASVVNNCPSGTSALMLGFGTGLTSYPRPGDFINFNDPSDYNHQKAYKIVGVEKNSYYQGGTVQPSTAQVRVHIAPPLQRDTTAGSTAVFINPKFRVRATSDVQEYQLSTDNLYSFSLAVEEIQP